MWSYALVRPQVTTAASSKLLNKLQYIENGTVRLLTSSWSHHPCPLVLLSSCPAVDRFQSPSLYSQPPPHTYPPKQTVPSPHSFLSTPRRTRTDLHSSAPSLRKSLPKHSLSWFVHSSSSSFLWRLFINEKALISQQTNKKMSVDVVSRGKSGRSVTAIKRLPWLKSEKLKVFLTWKTTIKKRSLEFNPMSSSQFSVD